MAFLTPLAVGAGALTLRKALPWLVLAAAITMLAAAVWLQTMRLQASRIALRAATAQVDLRQQDAERWRSAAGQRDTVIRDQARQLARLRADALLAQQVADDLEAARRKQVGDLDKQLKQLQARAHANPDQVRPLGPLVIDVLGSLHDRPALSDAAAAGH